MIFMILSIGICRIRCSEKYTENPNFVGYEEGEIAKDKNATKTKQYSKSYGKIKNKTITATLGNNGKLTISAANTNKIYRTKNYVDNWDEMKSYRLFALETGWHW